MLKKQSFYVTLWSKSRLLLLPCVKKAGYFLLPCVKKWVVFCYPVTAETKEPASQPAEYRDADGTARWSTTHPTVPKEEHQAGRIDLQVEAHSTDAKKFGFHAR